ncbi:MAG: phosphodiester glycosidase family protein [Armatimonadota bacterium]|nr:phosphodiester glycosidase family protein [Armatimonadota bacterium]MDR7452321.1 phosphodiester glycosidase family protein [Armatimonadota bacterium]MDR7467788.1 phosphodiester glycosidase family protein [Armatimonadota bacterium]MDR7494626.1 phosphodiester glycosidase family protein [Armatimonadota bacterium]MDR7499686.1 phosphodiester glycosidase family protein [Armatimonadota bacterium]
MRTLAVLVLIAATLPTRTPPAWAQPPNDVAGHWAAERIALLLRRGIAPPGADQTFRPDDPISRAEFLRWVIAAAGLPVRPGALTSFVDVPPYHPASPFVEAAVARGIIPRTPMFLPDAPVTRLEAAMIAVRAIGYAAEAAALALQPPPFEDAATLAEAERGAVNAALRMDPPLLAEPAAATFRPQDPMTRAEAASLAAGVLLGVENGVRLRATIPVAPGLELLVEKRGVLRAPVLWRVQVGAFTSESNARRLALRLQERGLPVDVEFQDGFYKVRAGNFASIVDAQALKERLGREGYATWVVQTLPSFEGLAGPSREAALFLDPTSGARLVPAVGDGGRMRRQRVSEIARRTGALAAANGGYFSAAGDPLGCLMIDGEWVSEPDVRRSCAGITAEGTVLFDRLHAEFTALAGEASARIDGLNRERRADELILYRPIYDASTRTNAFGAEAVVSNGVVVSVADQRGNSPIPRDGFVLSGHGRARQWILRALAPGLPVVVQTVLVPRGADSRWQQIVHAVGGGPRLLSGGEWTPPEDFPAALTDRRHPRTAIGVLADGRILLLVVDGRQPTHSLGMTLPELAIALRRLGAVEAMNLDGGGSSTLVVGHRVVNQPSDETGERPVAVALLVLGPQAPAPGP